MQKIDPEPSAPRTRHNFSVKFGAERPVQTGVTGDVSETGMFVITDAPLSEGSTVQLRLVLDAFSLPLRGVVAWSRDEQPDLQAGMGITLLRPPALYTHFVRELT